MTYTEDRATFEADLRKPPHFARMCEHAGRYVGRLTKVDKETMLDLAWEGLWQRREQIHETSDILLTWIAALSAAARTRKTWLVWHNMGGWSRVRASQLGRTE